MSWRAELARGRAHARVPLRAIALLLRDTHTGLTRYIYDLVPCPPRWHNFRPELQRKAVSCVAALSAKCSLQETRRQ